MKLDDAAIFPTGSLDDGSGSSEGKNKIKKKREGANSFRNALNIEGSNIYLWPFIAKYHDLLFVRIFPIHMIM